MLGAPTVKGDVAHPEDQLTLDQAEMYLTKSLKNNQFVVYYLQANGKVVLRVRRSIDKVWIQVYGL